jgi:hypothetical protein
MTVLEADGSATAQPNAGAPEVTNSTGTEGVGSSGAATADPFTGLDAGTREWVGKKGYKDVSDIAKAALNAESLIGRSIQVPGEAATPEEVDKFHAKVTESLRPKDPNGYEFKLPEGLPSSMPYPEADVGEFKAKAHELGLSPKQAAAIHDWYVTKQGGTFASFEQQRAQMATTATEAMEKDFGPADGEKFKEAVYGMGFAAEKLGFLPSLKSAGLLADDGTILDPTIGKALHTAYVSLFKEDYLATGMSGKPNPFSKETMNLTEQSRLIREEPDRARAFIRAAGLEPTKYRL